MSACDIIIPTFNSASILRRTLPALFSQSVPKPWSVRLIIADDGSADQTIAVVRNMAPPASWHRTLLVTGPHTGAAGARNRGLDHATAGLVLFLGADIILRPTALAAHLNFHNNYPDNRDAALGMVKWDPRLKPSPFMEWMIHGGGQNDFDSLLGQTQADPRHFFYGSHLSLKKKCS